MKTMTPHSIPVFLPNAGIGINRGEFSPQIRAIDVFYTDPIITGFHVVGDTSKCDSIFLEITGEDENSPKVIGFFGFKSSPECCSEVVIQEMIFESEEVDSIKGPEVQGFYGVESYSPCDQLFLEIIGDDENAPKVLGFFAGANCSTP